MFLPLSLVNAAVNSDLQVAVSSSVPAPYSWIDTWEGVGVHCMFNALRNQWLYQATSTAAMVIYHFVAFYFIAILLDVKW